MGERVLVCGGRDYADWKAVERELFAIAISVGIECIIHGGAFGADILAQEYADRQGNLCLEFPVRQGDWQTYGRAAGPIRNRRMLTEGKPTLVVAFPGGRGTADMVRQARAAGVPVREVDGG